VRAWNLNGWCTISGNPFVGPVALMPNHPDGEVATVEFGPIRLPEGADSITFFLRSSGTHEHEHTLGVDLAVLDRSQRTLATGHAALTHGEADTQTLTFAQEGSYGVFLRMAVGFDAFAGGPHYGKVWLSYLLAYPGNELVRPASVRLRAANGKAGLARSDLSLRDGVLRAKGTVSSRARGVARLILDFQRPDGSTGTWEGKATIADGRWSTTEPLPAEAAAGGYLSIQFTGYLKERMRGEQIAKQILP